jgi:hypothetical protein
MPKRGPQREQILWALNQAESGERVADIYREHGAAKPRSTSGKEVRGTRSERVARAASAARGNRQTQAAGRGPPSRSPHPPGDRAKKALKLRQRRELGRQTQAVFEMSERRLSRRFTDPTGNITLSGRRDPEMALGMRQTGQNDCARPNSLLRLN